MKKTAGQKTLIRLLICTIAISTSQAEACFGRRSHGRPDDGCCADSQITTANTYIVYAQLDNGRTWGFDRVVATENEAWNRMSALSNHGRRTFFQAFTNGKLIFTARIH